jgi:hypothetical protein
METSSINHILTVFPLSKTIPSKKVHMKRNSYNEKPTSSLVCFSENNPLHTFKEEESGRIWNLLPWYYNLLHNPIKNVKLICYDFHTYGGSGVGSSEIIVPKKAIEKTVDNKLKISLNAMLTGSYNYRDLYICGSFKHCLADVLPNIIYCKCVGK